jgi:hypothetical protein
MSQTETAGGAKAGGQGTTNGTAANGAPGALEVRDPRTGKAYPLALLERGTEGDEAVRASDLRAVKLEAGEFGVMSYDPAFMNTASCKSAITYIDGDAGILRYRGYPIEQLADNSTFLEVAYLLRHGDLPGQDEYTRWVHDITYHSYVHENIARFLQGFRHDAHPMAMLTSALAALSSFYPKAKDVHDPEQRYISIIRLLSKTPTIAAMIYRHMKGLPVVYPDNSLPYVENYLSMVARMGEPRYESNPAFTKALDVLFILHADHEQNCSTSAVRAVGSSHVDPFSAVAAGVAALYGPLHGGANEAVLRMIEEIGHPKNVPGLPRRGEGRQGEPAHGLRAPRVQELRPARQDREEAGVRRVRADRHGQGPRDRAQARGGGAQRRLLREPQALPERRLLHRPHLPLDGLPDELLHGAVRRGAHGRVAQPVGGDAARQGAEDRSAAADLRGARERAYESRLTDKQPRTRKDSIRK